MRELEALAERLEKATGADREIDAELQRAFLPTNCVAHVGCAGKTNAFTASLDAAVALCERVLPYPEWRWGVARGYSNEFKRHQLDAWISHRVETDYDPKFGVVSVSAPTPALALCLAVVRAKIAATPQTPASAAEQERIGDE